MDLSAVARQKARGGRAEPASPSATASMEADDHDSEGSDDDQPDPESAKQYVKQFVKNSLDGVRGGRRAQYYEVLEALDGLASATPSGDPDKLLMLEVLGENGVVARRAAARGTAAARHGHLALALPRGHREARRAVLRQPDEHSHRLDARDVPRHARRGVPAPEGLPRRTAGG